MSRHWLPRDKNQLWALHLRIFTYRPIRQPPHAASLCLRPSLLYPTMPTLSFLSLFPRNALLCVAKSYLIFENPRPEITVPCPVPLPVLLVLRTGTTPCSPACDREHRVWLHTAACIFIRLPVGLWVLMQGRGPFHIHIPTTQHVPFQHEWCSEQCWLLHGKCHWSAASPLMKVKSLSSFRTPSDVHLKGRCIKTLQNLNATCFPRALQGSGSGHWEQAPWGAKGTTPYPSLWNKSASEDSEGLPDRLPQNQNLQTWAPLIIPSWQLLFFLTTQYLQKYP